MSAPPVIGASQPEFDIPKPREPRIWVGWVALFVMLGFMFFAQLGQYLNRGKPGEKTYTSEIDQLRLSYDLNEVKFLRDPMKNGPNSLQSTLNEVKQDVIDDATRDRTAAIILSGILTEQGKPVPKEVLKRLATEKQDAEFSLVYASSTLSKEQATSLQKKLEPKGFLGKVAIVHAWRKAGEKDKFKIGDYDRAVVKLIALGIIGFAVLIGILLLMMFTILKISGYLPTIGIPLGKLSPTDADRMAIRAAQYVAAFLLVQLVGALIAYVVNVPSSVMNLGIPIGVIVAFVWLSKKPVIGQQFSLASMGITKQNLGTNIGWGLAAAVANAPIILITALVGMKLFKGLPGAEHPISTELHGKVNPIMLFVILVTACIAAPFIEEIMFRGSMLPAMARGLMPMFAAILFQGFLFASIHPTGIPAWLPLATIGAMSGFLTRQTGSLVPSIVMHGVHNFVTLLLALAIT